MLREHRFTTISRAVQDGRATIRTSTDASAGRPPEGGIMSSIVKVVEVIAQSDKSFDEAAQQAVREASASLRGIKSIWIDNLSGVVEGDRIVRFRVNAKLSFEIESHK